MIAIWAFVITYCLVCIVILGLGFGPSGVAAGEPVPFSPLIKHGDVPL